MKRQDEFLLAAPCFDLENSVKSVEDSTRANLQ